MKNFIKYILHKLLGFERYLYTFSLFKIYSLKWDKKENDFFSFMKLIPEGSAVLDIGANIGIMTVHLARDAKNIRVYAFEPVPDNLKILKRIIQRFHLKNVNVFDFALGDKEETVEMVMPVIDSVKMQGLSHVVHESIPENNEGRKFQVPVKMLDKVDELKKETSITAIKIDVENFEYFVLKGGEQLIRQHKPIIYIELWENENRKNCFNFIKEIGYQVNVVEDGKLKEYAPSVHQTQNFIFVPAN